MQDWLQLIWNAIFFVKLLKKNRQDLSKKILFKTYTESFLCYKRSLWNNVNTAMQNK